MSHFQVTVTNSTLFQSQICINAALGFDTYMVMRHGYRSLKDSPPSAPPTLPKTCIAGNILGCYFCSDVVGPTNVSIWQVYMRLFCGAYVQRNFFCGKTCFLSHVSYLMQHLVLSIRALHTYLEMVKSSSGGKKETDELCHYSKFCVCLHENIYLVLDK